MNTKKPCIRNLPAFRKGCPESDDCPAWIEESFEGRDGKIKTIKQCLDLWMFKFALDANILLEGNQQAVESFRNNTHDSSVNIMAMVQAKNAMKRVVSGCSTPKQILPEYMEQISE